MRKFVIALAALAVIATIAPSHAAGLSVSGTILAPAPESRVLGGVSEQVSPCNGSIDPTIPDGTAQGVDGFWIAIPDGSTGLAATLTADAPNDVDAWFYNDGCGLVKPPTPDAYSMATTDPAPNGDEHGHIPDGAAWVVVDLYAGAAANFTFTIG